MDWTEKHRPRSLKDLVGNGPAIAKLKAWADAWTQGLPEKRAVVLAGPPGTGKTSAALALAADMGWQPIELNASDARNATAIRRIATAGALHQTFSADGSFAGIGAGGGAPPASLDARRASKLIILDEADNLYERAGESGLDESGSDLSDKGGKAQIVETIRNARQPIVLIVNDLYALQKGSGSALRALAEEIKFQRVNVRSIPAALGRIAQAEGLAVDREVLESLAVKADGDLRAAVRDLQSIGLGRTRLTVKELGALGTRDTTGNLFDLVRHVLKGRPIHQVRQETWDTDATPEDLVLWMDENVPKEYKDPRDLVAGYEALSRADLFLGRTRRTQDYGLWAYAGELATLGVMMARTREYHGFNPPGFPQYLSKMGRTKGARQAKDELAVVLGRATHASKRKTRTDQVETFSFLFRNDREFATHQTAALELDDEQVALLMGEEATAKALKEIRAGADALLGVVDDERPRRGGKAAGPAAGDEDDGPRPAPAAEDKPGKPQPKPGQKGLFGF